MGRAKGRGDKQGVEIRPAAGFRGGGSIKVYAEMMKSLDAGIGKVLAALKATRARAKTHW